MIEGSCWICLLENQLTARLKKLQLTVRKSCEIQQQIKLNGNTVKQQSLLVVYGSAFQPFIRFRLPLPSIATSPFILLWADGAIFMVHRAFMVKPRYLLYIIRIMLFSMQQIGYDLQIWFITDSVSQIFFRFISTCAILKDERRRGFLLADSFTTVQWREFYCLHKCSCCCLKNCEDVF